MPYTKAHDPWQDFPNTTTPITAAALNTIEQGIADVDAALPPANVQFPDGTTTFTPFNGLAGAVVLVPAGQTHASLETHWPDDEAGAFSVVGNYVDDSPQASLSVYTSDPNTTQVGDVLISADAGVQGQAAATFRGSASGDEGQVAILAIPSRGEISVGQGGTLFQIQVDADGTHINPAATNLGINGAAPIAKPTVTGSRGGNAALASLLTALANLGHITDSSSA